MESIEAKIKQIEEELNEVKKLLEEEKAKNAKLEQVNTNLQEENEKLRTENTSLKEQIQQWTVKYEAEHQCVLKLTKENEELKAKILELEQQKEIEDEKPYDAFDLKEYMRIQNELALAIQKLETEQAKTNEKLEKLDKRERKTDEKLLKMINNTTANIETPKTDTLADTPIDTSAPTNSPGEANFRQEVETFYASLE